MRKIISILAVNEEIIDSDFTFGASDFENAVQYMTAEKNEIDFIIIINRK